jgi:hypothetical protein
MPNRIETLLGQRRSRKRCGAVPQFIKAPLATLEFYIVKKNCRVGLFFSAMAITVVRRCLGGASTLPL